MAGRYLDGERPAAAADSPLGPTWTAHLDAYRDRFGRFLLDEALGALWEFVGATNRHVDAEQPWVLAKQAKAGDAEAAARLRSTLGDLVEACRLIGLAAAPFIPGIAPRVLEQLGYSYPYGPDGNGGPAILDELAWGAHATESGRLGTAEPLFPRLEVEAAEEAAPA
jgi:methionyl-tRNA synthetase